MRLRGTTGSALEEIGEDTEGLIEDFSKLNGKIKALTKTASNPAGVSIVDQLTGGYKSTYQILLEISKVWEDIGDMQKAELLEIMAGELTCPIIWKHIIQFAFNCVDCLKLYATI